MRSMYNLVSRLQFSLKHFKPTNSVKLHTDQLNSIHDPVKEEESHVFERSINEVMLLGRVRDDPAIVENNGRKYVHFFLLTVEETGRGSKQLRRPFHSIFTFNPSLLKNVEKFVKKGDRLLVSGRLSYLVDHSTMKTHRGVYLKNYISLS